MKKILSSILLMGLSLPLLSAEVDHFTNRHLPLVDSSAIINNAANAHLEDALRSANHNRSCSYSKKSTANLYDELKKHFANHTKGEFVKDILAMRKDISHSLRIQDSVYRRWNITNGLVTTLSLASRKPLALFPLLNFKGHSLGLDKFEHMFGMGFIYFNRHNLNKKSLGSVLKHGILRERTVLGGFVLATGVYSYADLSANFNGMRFWNHILQQQDDVLGEEFNHGPYVKCEDGKWKAVKKIDFSNYIDDSMDESMNCSNFASRGGLKKFKRAVKQLSPEYSCPMSTDKINNMQSKYDVPVSSNTSISDLIINTNGNQKR
jgi:hypothetical protein